MKFGIDISHHNKIFDYEKAFTNKDFIIIRAGFGKVKSQIDKNFKMNIENAEKYKVPYGIYWYSYAKTIDDAKKEVETCIEILKEYNVKPAFPVFVDIEDTVHMKNAKKTNIEIVKTFCDAIEKAGFKAGFYTYHAFMQNFLDVSKLEKYDFWYANCTTTANELTEKYSIHQYTFKMESKGIIGKVDGDKMSDDYFNRYVKTEKEVTSYDALRILEKVAGLID